MFQKIFFVISFFLILSCQTPPPVSPGAVLSADSSVQPFADGEELYPQIKKLIEEADDFIFMANWGIDESLLMDGTSGQRDSYGDEEPTLLNCPKFGGNSRGSWPTMLHILRCKASDMAESKRITGIKSAQPYQHLYSNIRVVAWDNPLDKSSYERTTTDLGHLNYFTVSMTEVRGWSQLSSNDVTKALRAHGTGESEVVLLKLYNFYKTLSASYNGRVIFPTGIFTVSQKNNSIAHASINRLASTHHQKTVISEKAGYIGGINFLKDFWDTKTHPYVARNMRYSSGFVDHVGHWTPASYNAYTDLNPPYHDTGSIVKGAVLGQFHNVFETRWRDLMAEKTTREERHIFGSLLRNLPTVFASATGADKTILAAAETYIRDVQFSREGNWQAPTLRSTSIDTGFKTDKAVAAFSIPPGSISTSGYPTVIGKYQDLIGKATRPVSFMYIENQYLQDTRIAEAVMKSSDFPGGRFNRDGYAYFVLPFTPEGIGVQFLDNSELKSVVSAEMQNMKWLEVKSGRFFYKRGSSGQWEIFAAHPSQTPDCPMVNRYAKFIGPADTDPSQIRLNTKIEISSNEYDSNGNPVEYPVACHSSPNCMTKCPVMKVYDNFTVEDIMTRGPIEAYTIAASNSYLSNATTPDDRYQEFFVSSSYLQPLNGIVPNPNYAKGNGVYIHSKASMFAGLDDQTNWATVGSANLNKRSLGGNQCMGINDCGNDTESNIFWSSPSVMDWVNKIWDEHTDGKLNTPSFNDRKTVWQNYAWENMENIRRIKKLENGRVVRLDVVLRCKKLNACP